MASESKPACVANAASRRRAMQISARGFNEARFRYATAASDRLIGCVTRVRALGVRRFAICVLPPPPPPAAHVDRRLFSRASPPPTKTSARARACSCGAKVIASPTPPEVSLDFFVCCARKNIFRSICLPPTLKLRARAIMISIKSQFFGFSKSVFRAEFGAANCALNDGRDLFLVLHLAIAIFANFRMLALV